MKTIKLTLTLIALIFVVNAVNAQVGPRPRAKSDLGRATESLSMITQEPAEIIIDENGNSEFYRLSGLQVGAFVGGHSDGVVYGGSIGYKVRIPSSPWARVFVPTVTAGMQDLNVDGLKTSSFFADGIIRFDLMDAIAPKSRFVANVGLGYGYNKVNYDARIVTSTNEKGEQKGFDHKFSASAWGPVVKLELGYNFSRTIALKAGVSYKTFGVAREIPAELGTTSIPDYKYSGISGTIGVTFTIGGKVKK